MKPYAGSTGLNRILTQFFTSIDLHRILTSLALTGIC